MTDVKMAPGGPGNTAIWTSGAKTGIGKALNSESEVLFTISEGIVTEVYYPREDIACIKDIACIVTDGKDFFSEEKNDTSCKTVMIKEGIPAYRITNTCLQNKYIIEKEIIVDPYRDTLLQQIHFKTSKKIKEKLQLYITVAPHVNNNGSKNTGWVGNYKGNKMMFAGEEGLVLAVACSVNILKRSVGYAGASDGWLDLKQHKKIEWEYERAENGNIIITFQPEIQNESSFILAIGFGRTFMEAGNHALASMLDGFETSKKRYIEAWENWLQLVKKSRGKYFPGKYMRTSAVVLKMNEAKSFPGGIIAALSIPWGMSRSDSDIGGYHLVWPRDLVQCGGAFVALNAKEDASRIINYLMSTQEADGRWMQNMWLEGDSYWSGIQMDQVALPIILAELCYREKIIDRTAVKRYWPNIQRAIIYILSNGPSTEQDRWEQQPGFNVFTIATEITGLLAGALLAEVVNEDSVAAYCRDTADCWNNNIEKWTYITNTKLANDHDVDGYYIRSNPFGLPANEVADRTIPISHYKSEQLSVAEFVCVDALALVRFGLRKADDQKIINTVKLIDALLKVETPYGASWHRFVSDPYGEDDKGNPFDKNSANCKGRAWPLLTGERAHYEIARGNIDAAKKLLATIGSFTQNGFISEQVWDAENIPEKKLYFGKPTGSAMPLSWAHAEYIKLCFSIRKKKVVDMPPYTVSRYVQKNTISKIEIWNFRWQPRSVKKGKILRIETNANAVIHWTGDSWHTNNQIDTRQAMPNIFYADIDTLLIDSNTIEFTFFWKSSNNWENKNFQVKIEI